jgi:hypothetical protein
MCLCLPAPAAALTRMAWLLLRLCQQQPQHPSTAVFCILSRHTKPISRHANTLKTAMATRPQPCDNKHWTPSALQGGHFLRGASPSSMVVHSASITGPES